MWFTSEPTGRTHRENPGRSCRQGGHGSTFGGFAPGTSRPTPCRQEDAMKPRPWISWALVGTVVLLFSSVPALSGVHLWRLTETFSNTDGTIQFIEMTTCCGSVGGEIFVSGQSLSSNSHSFTFPPNLTMATANKHLLLATSGFAALPGAPAPDYIIADNFFSTGGDTIPFAVFDTMIFPAGVHPTDGTKSLNKKQDHATHTTLVAPHSPPKHPG